MNNQAKKILAITVIGCAISCSNNEPCFVDNQDVEIKERTTIKLSRAENEIVNGQTSFALNLFNRMVHDNNESNVLIAPYSVASVISMLANGAQGEEAVELISALGFSNIDSINSLNLKLITSIPSLDPKTTINIANSIWVHPSGDFQTEFVETLKSYYDASVAKVDMTGSEGVASVNQWCYDATSGMIPTIINGGDEVYSSLINALTFRGAWSMEFNKTSTARKAFIMPDREAEVDMMCREGYKVAIVNNRRIARLDYGNGSFRMTIIPTTSEDASTNVIVGELNSGLWQSIKDKKFDEIDSKIYMPRFEIESDGDLLYTLSKWLPHAFGDDNSYPKVGKSTKDNDFKVQRVYHKVKIIVDEEGSKAAAVTSVEDCATDLGPNATISDYNFYVNRPFVFVIDEENTGTILVAGTINTI